MTDAGPPNPPGSIRVAVEGDELVLHLQGEIDAATVRHYETAAAQGRDPSAAAATQRVTVIDAAGVTFLNSIGVRFLLRQTEVAREAGRRPRLRRPTRPVRLVLRLTGLEEIFDVVEW